MEGGGCPQLFNNETRENKPNIIHLGTDTNINMLEYVEMCENLRTYVDICGNVWKAVEIYGNVTYVEMCGRNCRNLWKYVEAR